MEEPAGRKTRQPISDEKVVKIIAIPEDTGSILIPSMDDVPMDQKRKKHQSQMLIESSTNESDFDLMSSDNNDDKKVTPKATPKTTPKIDKKKTAN